MTKHWGLALAVGSVALGGCNSTIFEPFDADQGSVSMDARQRTIISVERGTPPDSHRIVCAEPSPDALATIAASAAASGGVSGLPQLPGSAELAGGWTSAEQAASIGARNSTVQLLRDGLYRACEAYLNGALGDFGYGLVLVNYGRLMVALLTADGLAHPPMVPPVVIGSMVGNITTTAKGSASVPAKEEPAPDAAGVVPAAGPVGSANHETAANVGAGTASSAAPGAAAAPAGQISGEQAERIFTNVVLPLANPTSDPAGKFIEVTVACMLWLDNTGLKKTKSEGDADLHDLCNAMVKKAPQLAEPAIYAKLADLYEPSTLAAAASFSRTTWPASFEP